jgi:hypothetical protein
VAGKVARRALGPVGDRLSPPGPGARREFNHTHTLLNPSHVDGRQLEVEFWWRRPAASADDDAEIYLRFEPAARRYLHSMVPCDWELVVATTLGRDDVYLVIEREPFDRDDEPHEQYVLRADIPGTVRTVGDAALDACEAELREAASRERRPAKEVLGTHLGPCHTAGTVPWLDAILSVSATRRGLAVGRHSVPAGTEAPVVELSDVWGDLVVTLAHPGGPEVQPYRLCDTFTHQGVACAVLAPWPRGDGPKHVVALAPSAIRCLDTATFDEAALAHLGTQTRYLRVGPHPSLGERRPDPELVQVLRPPR